MSEIEKTLEQRGSRYGDWMDQGQVSDQIITAMEQTKSWPLMPGWMRQAYRMIAEKMARACTGDYLYPDNLHDIAGYATIGEERLHRFIAATWQEELPLPMKSNVRASADLDSAVRAQEANSAAALKAQVYGEPMPVALDGFGEPAVAAPSYPAELDPSDGA